MSEPVTGNGTKDDPWVLRTPPGQSKYLAYRDADADPADPRLRRRRDDARLPAALP